MPKFSIVIPVYYNAANLPETIPQLLALRDQLSEYTLELIFVDDGSGDNSLDILLAFQAQHPETIRIAKLSRNFGSMAAIQAGLHLSTGDCVGIISADLQDPPELFVEMLNHWKNGAKAIFAVRQSRDEPLLQRFLSNAFYALIRALALPNYPSGGFDFFVVDRQLVRELNSIQEKNTNIMSLLFWLGHKPILLPYARRRRLKGKSRWTLAKKSKLLIDTFVAFSFFPIRFFSILGILVAAGSFAYGAFVFVYWLVFGIAVKGFVPTILIITLSSGLQMVMLGILGEYLWRVLDEVRRRPGYVVDEVFGSADNRHAEAALHTLESQ